MCKEGKNNWLNNFQTLLDAIGLFDPTGIADFTNALIYSGRGQWGYAGISMLAVIPYLGDTAKVGKYGTKTLRKITVIGSERDIAKYLGRKGFNVLNINNWTPSKNIKWLDKAITRGDEILLATDPLKHQSLMKKLNKASAFLDLELPHLLDNGFVQDGVRMIREGL